MPRVFVLMKDVLSCVKLRGAAKRRYYPGISEWGNLFLDNLEHPQTKVWQKCRKIVCVKGTLRTETS